MKISGYDFSGWATKNDLECADGLTIRHDAFKVNDGTKVPLMWNHKHDTTSAVLGHAILENRDDGVFTYGFFNNTKAGQEAKEILQHGDVEALSIYANNLIKQGRDVIHGAIREVSLVLAGANPGAFVESVMAHGYPIDEDDDEGLLYTGTEIILPDTEISHAEFDKKKKKEDEDEGSEEKENKDTDSKSKTKFSKSEENDKEEKEEKASNSKEEETNNSKKEDTNMADTAKKEPEEKKGSDDETVGEVFDTLTDKQKTAVYAIIAELTDGLDDNDNENDDEDDDEEDSKMKHNLFDDETITNETVLQHSMILNGILDDAKKKKVGSLKEMIEDAVNDGVLAHSVPTEGMTVADAGTWRDNIPSGRPTEYGFNDPEFLFPEAQALSNTPEWIQRNQDWVTVLMNGIRRSPFSRVKSVFANITEDEARAKGYIKTHQKKEEIFALLKRVTTPTTVYKKQRMDRDDIVDITDFDVVAWIKGEMRIMLNEEIARAILIGDGRATSSEDKIDESCIRPIASDVDLFTIKCGVKVASGATLAEKADATVDSILRSRKDYRGSGNPILFTTEEQLTEMLLLKDGIGHRLYKTEAELATALRVSRIQTVEILENAKISIKQTVGSSTSATDVEKPLIGVIVNPADYNVGADKGGSIETFDDFDIDFNQYVWLMEGRMSGALVRPFSAISVYLDEQAAG